MDENLFSSTPPGSHHPWAPQDGQPGSAAGGPHRPEPKRAARRAQAPHGNSGGGFGGADATAVGLLLFG